MGKWFTTLVESSEKMVHKFGGNFVRLNKSIIILGY